MADVVFAKAYVYILPWWIIVPFVIGGLTIVILASRRSK
jgi:hypothetical protein